MNKLMRNLIGLLAVTAAATVAAGQSEGQAEKQATLKPFFARYERSGSAGFEKPLPASVEAVTVRQNGRELTQVEMRMVTGRGEYLIDRFQIDPAGLHTIGRDFARSGNGPEFDTSIEDGQINQVFRRGTGATGDDAVERRLNALETPVFDPGLAPFIVAARGMKTRQNYSLDILYSGFNRKKPAVVPADVEIGGERTYAMPDGSRRKAFDVKIDFTFPNGRTQARTYVLSNEPPYQLAAHAGQHWRLSAF